jgi:hypothetical protein
VSACQFPATMQRGDRCAVCGHELRRDYDLPVYRHCGSEGNAIVDLPLAPGLGDRVAKLLAAVGITEARWLAIKGVVVEQPTCGCQKRRETLNRWGRWLASWKS